MKYLLCIIVAAMIFSCNTSTNKEQELQSRIDSLQKQVANTYKPGFGEFMSSIQSHHAKLWFAGQNHNWKLCDFEIHEIMEAFDGIEQYETERKESKLVNMIKPALDSVNKAIEQKNDAQFKNSFIQLTNTCNSCHRAAEFEFNVVKIPDVSTFSNQDFGTKEKNK
ncbi:MAG: hypothetical protein JST86_17210 [Bacteroidetes bacterium]|nr:hypothetical protein [Bacteroidota bacterium]